MAKTPQWYREYLEDARQQIGWLDRVFRFRRAIREGVPALLQQSEGDETLLSLLVADLRILPAPLAQRCLFVLTSHNLHVYPQQHSRITTFVGDQILPLWKVDNISHTIEINFVPSSVLPEALSGESIDPQKQGILSLRVRPQDWMAANFFWAAGLAAANHWRDPAAIIQHMEDAMHKVFKP